MVRIEKLKENGLEVAVVTSQEILTYKSKSLKDFMYESNKGRTVFF